MIPNYKRPKYRDYISDVLERPLDDQDLDMITHIEELETIRIIYNSIKDFISGEDFRIKHALHELGNSRRDEYSGLLLGKAEVIRDLKWRIENIENAQDIASIFKAPIQLDLYDLVAIPKSEIERLRELEANSDKGYKNTLYCPKHIETGEYIDEDGNRTDDIVEAIGCKSVEDCTEYISQLDEPEDWIIEIKKVHIYTKEV